MRDREMEKKQEDLSLGSGPETGWRVTKGKPAVFTMLREFILTHSSLLTDTCYVQQDIEKESISAHERMHVDFYLKNRQ